LARYFKRQNLCEALKCSLERHGKSPLIDMNEFESLTTLFGNQDLGAEVNPLKEELK